MKLPVVRHRKKLRLRREQAAIRDALYNEIVNADGSSDIQIAMNGIKAPEDGAPFASWDKIIKSFL